MTAPSTSRGVSKVVSRSQLGGLDRRKGVLKLLVSLLKLPVNMSGAVRVYLSSLLDPSKPLLPFIPKPLKVAALLILLLYASSWPFAWHIRVWKHPLYEYYRAYRTGRSKWLVQWKKECDASGGIFTVSKTKRRAAADDIDYNLHLSNSSYAKSVDEARMQWCIAVLSPIFAPGVAMALGASHYVFFKEIPMYSPYVMESRVGGWGDKWLYLVTEFVIFPSSGKGKGRGKGTRKGPIQEPGDGAESAGIAATINNQLAGPNETGPGLLAPVLAGAPESNGSSPSPSPSPSPAQGAGAAEKSNGTRTQGQGQGHERRVSAVTAQEVKMAALRNRKPRSDGGVVCCLAVSEYCFKVGRVTVPPRIALFGALLSPTQDQRDRADRLLQAGRKQAGQWLKGGWKDEPDADTIGADIGLRREEGAAEKGTEWINRGRDGMDKVVEGLGVF